MASRRALAGTGWLVAAVLATVTSAPQWAHAATAIVAHVDGETTFEASAPTLIGASAAAAQQCTEQFAATECEVVSLNGSPVTTAHVLRDAPADAPLMMWRINDADTEIALVGSIHALKSTLLPLPQPIESAFKASSHIVVEADILKADAGQLDPGWLVQKMTLANGATIDQALRPAQTEKLKTILRDTGLPFAQVALMKPAFVTMTLSVARFGTLGYDPQLGMEMQFLRRAGSRPVIELEGIGTQIELLANTPIPVQLEMLDESLVDDAEVERTVADLIKAWYAGDTETLASLFVTGTERSRDYVAFQKAFLDDRNVAMAAKIYNLLDTKGRFFVLVGAAHLAGPNNIIDLLRSRGLAPARILADGTAQPELPDGDV